MKDVAIPQSNYTILKINVNLSHIYDTKKRQPLVYTATTINIPDHRQPCLKARAMMPVEKYKTAFQVELLLPSNLRECSRYIPLHDIRDYKTGSTNPSLRI